MTVSERDYIRINDEIFPIARDQNSRLTWVDQQIPTQEGDPLRPGMWKWRDWSRGMGDSRGAFRGSVEYAEGAYLGLMGRILPGHAVSQIETNCDADVKDIAEVNEPASRIVVCGGTKVVEVNPSTHAVADTETVSGDAVSMQYWDGDQLLIAVGDATDYYVRDNTGSYSQNSISKKARAFGLGANGLLVRGYQNAWASCDAQEVTSVDNWSTDYELGDPTRLVTQVFSHNRWDYVLKEEGLYTFDEETSKESNTLTDLENFAGTENRWVFKWYDHVFVCTHAGLYRYIQQGAARPVGIENLQLNESEMQNVWPTAGAAMGTQMYVAYTDGTSTWIVAFRRGIDGDANFGAGYTATSVIDKFTGYCRAMRISDASGAPRLYYGAGGDLRHFGLTRDGRPATYRSTGSYTVRLSPTDFGNPFTLKQFVRAQVVARNVDATQTIQLQARMDGGSANNVGTAIAALSGTIGERSWTRGTNDAGRVMQLIVTGATDDAANPLEIREINVDYEERPEMVPGAIVGLVLRDGQGGGRAKTSSSAKALLETLQGHMDGPIVEVTDIYGRTYEARLSQYQGEVPWAYKGETPAWNVAVSIRELTYV